MFFRFMRGVVRVVLFLINGNARYQNKEVLPKNENYILVAPHRTWWDPLYLAVAARPKKFSFMAKEELFKNPILRFILIHANAFPVKRDKPGPSAVKTPVKILKETDLSLIMFQRKRVTVRFGEPIDISDIKKMDKEGLAEVERRIQGAFDTLDQAIDPSFVYQIDESKRED